MKNFDNADLVDRLGTFFQRENTNVPGGQVKVEHVAINDVLPLKAARRDAIAKLLSFWGPETPAT